MGTGKLPLANLTAPLAEPAKRASLGQRSRFTGAGFCSGGWAGLDKAGSVLTGRAW